jgi:antitoxin component HigA of HigAB toxin-antitoxin module
MRAAMNDIQLIRNETDYDAALEEVEQYFKNEPLRGTPEGDRFENGRLRCAAPALR